MSSIFLTLNSTAQRGGHTGGGGENSRGGQTMGGGHYENRGYSGRGYNNGSQVYAYNGRPYGGYYGGGYRGGYPNGYGYRSYARPNFFYYLGIPRIFINPPVVIHNGWNGYYHQGCDYCLQGYCNYHQFYDQRLYDQYYNMQYYQQQLGNDPRYNNYNNVPNQDYNNQQQNNPNYNNNQPYNNQSQNNDYPY